MFDATTKAFFAHSLALPTSAARDTGGFPGLGGGSCCARDMERLFTAYVSEQKIIGIAARAHSGLSCDSLRVAKGLSPVKIVALPGSADSSPHNDDPELFPL
jgi:hypothetical protein